MSHTAHTIRCLSLFLVVLVASAAAAEETNPGEHAHGGSRHQLSVILGATDNDEGTGFTAGFDYEYELSERFGVGAVLENAFGNLDALTVLAVADIRVWKGLKIQTGPGVEFIHGGHEAGEQEAVYRVGLLYEVDVGQLIVSPQVHYDFTTGEDSLVVGLGVGVRF